MTPTYLGPFISTTAKDTYRLGCNGAPTGNDFLGIKWSRDSMTDEVT